MFDPSSDLTTAQLIAESQYGPVLIFKRSPWCFSSILAGHEVDQLARQWPELSVHHVDVFRDRALSGELAFEFGIGHASPQVLLLLGGQVRWWTSHGGITSEAISGALLQISTQSSLDAFRVPAIS